MISLITGAYDAYLQNREISILLVGCNGAGKTSLLERIKVTAWDNASMRYKEPGLQVNSNMKQHIVTQDSFHLLDPYGRFRKNLSHQQTAPTRGADINDDKDVQYDLKHGKRMLPSHLIRPTIGMNLTKIDAFGFRIKVIDLGGSLEMRSLWTQHYSTTCAIVYVVDVSGQSTIEQLMEARAFYRFMTDDDSVNTLPILIFFNKVDLRKNDDGNLSTRPIDENRSLNNYSLLQIASLFLKPVYSTPNSIGAYLGTHKKIQENDSNLTCFYLNEHCETNTSTNIQSVRNINHLYSDHVSNNIALTAGSSITGENVFLGFQWLIHKVQASQH